MGDQIEPTASTATAVGIQDTWPSRRIADPLARWGRPLAVGLLLAAAIEFVVLYARSGPSHGVDFLVYRSYVASFVTGHGLYAPWQLAGPYEIHGVFRGQPFPEHGNPSLYPPIIIAVLAPFLVLPALLYWVVPLAVIGYAIWRLRPSPWALALIGAICLLPRVPTIILYGNPVLWCVAALAAGFVWKWPALLVVLKPTLLPFALFGIRSRSWWIATFVLVVVNVPLLPVWLDWFTAVRNAQGSLLYSLPDVPAMLIPVVAYVGRHE